MAKNINNKLKKLIKYYSLINHNLIFNNKSINRYNQNQADINKSNKQYLQKLRDEINEITNYKLKDNASNLVFSDGNPDSKVMIIGEGPGQKEDEIGKPFVGDAGILLNKMLKAININRDKIYITNVVNYRPPDNRKPEPTEIIKYSNFLREHISIIDPKLLILMGSTAMEALVGNNIKISKDRGKWKEIIIKNKTFISIVTFHPAYLLRQPDQKKYSWSDLKEIRKKIDELNINI